MICFSERFPITAALQSWPEVLEKQKSTLTKLSKDLSEIKRKSDYRYSSETLTDEEKVAWIKAVKLMTGEAGIQK